jgi:hypothetical protein|tara:strand:- start:2281 stop:2481 length:201 start_codon:yes stop_codon:yes gene_type:complete
MKEQMKETIIVESFNLLQKLKGIVETQQTQLNILIDDNTALKQRVTSLEDQLNIKSHLNSDDKRFI